MSSYSDSYKAAGVDVTAGYRAVELMKKHVARTVTSGVLDTIGGFGGMFELDLTLRNNITTDEHPLGVYHPHAEYHHIKKENIGLIEVMGLAVLPARLKEELELLAEYILEGKDISSNEKIEKHAAWVAEFLPKYDNLDKDNIQDVLRKEVGNVFVHVLEDAGVYKCTAEGREAFMRFINKL